MKGAGRNTLKETCQLRLINMPLHKYLANQNDETAPGFNGILTSFYAKLFDMYKVIIPATVMPKINFKSPAIKKICSSINSGAHYLKSHRFFDHPTNTFH